MAGWHHQIDGHEFEQALGDSERQGSLVFNAWRGGLACCSPEDCRVGQDRAPEQQQASLLVVLCALYV